ncbi:hypothetical protein [Clostridium estertheticum]|uniref:hypothetical protein n=1 Tax=Clostridium estertheticum TaxID=238834 RepID=UPI001CF4553A|nr:hypothetical protein [Clostridium estertheticum]MCB2339954.1 hypothetical protein [Clostridium estertheticum]
MKVNNIIGYLGQIKKIFDIYEDKTLEYMLSDIYSKVAINENTYIKYNKNKQKVCIEEIIQEIKKNNMNKDEVVEFIRDLKKNELLLLGEQSKLKINKSDNKELIVEIIANHFGFIELDNQIANRTSNETSVTAISNMDEN